MSELTYNGIALSLVKTRMIARDRVTSPDGSDQVYIRHTFDVECLYNPGATAYQSSSADDDGEDDGDQSPAPVAARGTLPVFTDVAIRERLMEPRKSLVFAINNQILLQSPSPGLPVDAQNGPLPIACNVLRIDANKTFLVSYKVETFVSECKTPGEAADDPLLSNRYEVNHVVDDQDQTAIQTSGIAMFRMDALGLSPTGNADHFRNRCLPPVPPGFQRKSITAKVNSIGNMLVWSCYDQQMFYSIGSKNIYGVKKFEAVYTQSSNPVTAEGVQSIFDGATLDVRVWGNVNSARMNLIKFAVQLAIERLQIVAGPVVGVNPLIRMVSVSEQLHDRIIDLRVAVQLPVAKQGVIGLAAINGKYLGLTLDTTLANDGLNPQMPNDSNTRGTYTGELFAAALQEACSRVEPVKSSPGQTQGYPDAPVQNYTPPDVSSTVTDDLPTQDTRYSDATTDSASYTEYKVESTYENDTGNRACPVAGPEGTLPVVLKLYASLKKVKQTWEVERVGSKPNVPTPVGTDQRMVLLSSSVRPSEVYLAPDGETPVYRVAGEYRYVFMVAGNEDVPIPYPTVPWTTFNFGDDAIEDEDYAHGIIDSADSSTAIGDGGTTGA